MRRIVVVLTGAMVMAVMLAINASTALPAPRVLLDPTFGDRGTATTDFFSGDDIASGIAIQPDGKLVAAGTENRRDLGGFHDDFGLARYNSDGSLDTSFGNGGNVTTAFFVNSNDDAQDVALQADDKIVVAGSAFNFVDLSWYFALARYNSDGSLDTSFGNGGKVTTDVSGGNDYAHAVAIQQDGKIVASGVSVQPPQGEDPFTNSDFGLTRYNKDGSLDTSFDGDGKVTTDFSGSEDIANAIAIQDDGKIVAAGSNGEAGFADFGLARYNTDGSLDTSFDGDGKVITDFDSSFDEANAVAIQDDGKIIAVGAKRSDFDFALARYNPDGSLDTSFDGDGKVATDFSRDRSTETTDKATAVTLQQDGKIVAAGNTSGTDLNTNLALARYNSGGSLDASFGITGKLTTDLGHGDSINDLALQQDGKIVAAGQTNPDGSDYDHALVRYLPKVGTGP